MKTILTIFTTIISNLVLSQCIAFSEGCWTLLGVSNGVELYATHKKVLNPSPTARGFYLSIYTKIVNTNDYAVSSGQGYIITVDYYDIDKKEMKPYVFADEKNIEAKQTIIKNRMFITTSPDVWYREVPKFYFSKKN